MSDAWIPLVDEADLPASISRLTGFMGMVPTSMRAYGHLPAVMDGVIGLEMALLPEGCVDVLIKARVGYVVSRLNGCRYCAAHVGGRLRNNGVGEEELAYLIGDLPETGDAATDAAVAFARLATVGAATQDSVTALARHFRPEQIVEIACVVGFYCFLNRVHSALGLEIEDHFARIGAHRIAPAGAPAKVQ